MKGNNILANYGNWMISIVFISTISIMFSGSTTVWSQENNTSAAAETSHSLRIPAYTAYTLPNPDGARISQQRGITNWTDPELSVNWYGLFKQAGTISAKVDLKLPEGASASYSLTVAGQTHSAQAVGVADNALVTADFGKFQINQPGYQQFMLLCLNKPDQPFGNIDTLILDGPALEGAHFNLKERRNAASVHLSYQVPENTNIEAFYCEVTAVEDPVCTFYMACGWHRGYFGMQVNSPTERRIIFSVWDSGGEAVDRGKVSDENRVILLDKGDGVYSGDFGNEGTGGHSHLKYMWKTGQIQRFLVTAEPVNGTHTIFSGYYFHPDSRKWMLISSWKAPKEGGYLKRPHSFSENFWGSSGHIQRKALYGNQWIRTDQGKWIEVTTASFSHDPTGREDRLDRFMGVENGQFFLSHGGFIEGYTKFGEKFNRPATKIPPSDIILPKPRNYVSQ